MSLIAISAQTTTPPGATARSANGTSAPAAAKTIAASSGSGGSSVDPPAHSAPSSRANACVATSPGRVNAKTRRPWCRATCVRMCAAPPNPMIPSRSASPASRRARYPISPAHSSGAAWMSGNDVRHREAVPRVGDGEFRVAAGQLIAGEARVRAEVLPAGRARAADAARPPEPRHADPVADRQALGALAERVDDADDLMPEDRGAGPVR